MTNPWAPKPREPKNPIVDIGGGVGMIKNPTADMFKPGGPVDIALGGGDPDIPKHDNTDVIINGVPTPVQDVEEADLRNMSEAEMKEYMEKLIQYGEEKATE